jgi:hypothetical protein
MLPQPKVQDSSAEAIAHLGGNHVISSMVGFEADTHPLSTQRMGHRLCISMPGVPNNSRTMF